MNGPPDREQNFILYHSPGYITRRALAALLQRFEFSQDNIEQMELLKTLTNQDRELAHFTGIWQYTRISAGKRPMVVVEDV